MSAKRLLIAAALLLAASACGDSEPDANELDADVNTLLETSSAAMGTVDTVRFEIERGGVPVYIDPTDTLEFKDAVGRFVAPQAADAVVKVAVNGINVQIGAIAIDGSVWLSNPITGAWEPAPSTYAFDPTSLFSPDVGWRPLLGGELRDARLIGREDFNGVPRYHIDGIAPQERIETITANLVRDQDVHVDIWLDTVTGHVLEVIFDAETSAGVSNWRLTFFGYGDEIDIVPPDELSGG
ncbi:MAG: LppX_LprAFG lipoprotein [Acidimicrobiia bacterium]|nr:LppX_LprAFG lipoprotein [Acidimicrobiia bacterium]